MEEQGAQATTHDCTALGRQSACDLLQQVITWYEERPSHVEEHSRERCSKSCCFGATCRLRDTG